MSSARLLLWEAAIFGPMRHAAGRTLLGIVAIALGVALGLAIHLINGSAADEMSAAARSLYGLADLAVEGAGDGFDEGLYPRIARVEGVEAASPEVIIEAKLADRRGTLTLIGVDPFRSRLLQPAFAGLAGTMSAGGEVVADSNAVVLTSRAARALGLSAGQALEIQVGLARERLTVAAVLPAAALDDYAGIIDIAAAQWRFNRLGKLSGVKLRLHPGASVARVRDSLAQLLPKEVRVLTPGQASDDAVRLSRAYRANLTALALVALFTGGFLVYSTQALATLRRRREFAVMHALGVTRRQQLAYMLCGAGIIGLIGSLLGGVAGYVIANIGLRALGADLGAGYFRGVVPELGVRLPEVLAFCSLGIVVAIAGTLRPAIDAARIPTASALKAADVGSDIVRSHWPMIALLIVPATVALFLPPIAGLPLPGYASIALLILTTIVAMPSVMRAILAHLPLTGRPTYEIALSQLRGAASHATLSVTSVVVSFSLMVAMAIMVTSFRGSLDQWMQRMLPADLYLRAGYIGQSSHLDEATIAALRAVPGVERLAASRFARVTVPPERSSLILIATTVEPSADDLWVVDSTKAATPEDATSVWVSEAAADLLALAPGKIFTFVLEGKDTRAFVRGVWRDYEHQDGAIMVAREAYTTLSGDRYFNSASLWLSATAREEEVRTAVRLVLPPNAAYDLRAPGELRRLSLQAFDRTFAVTYALEAIAVIIGLCGIAAGTSAQVLARRREFGVLRHLGFERRQIAATLAIEGIVLGALGVLIGLATGVLVGLILIYIVNRQSFHWSMELSLPGVLLTVLSLLLVISSASIAVLSGRRAMSGDVVAAVKEDW